VSFVSDLDTPLLSLSPRDRFTLRDACNGVHIFGGIGSGKTSGSGKALAAAYLRAGLGGLVLCAKPDEVDLWVSYARANGREKSVVLFNERKGFNFIAYELARQGMKGIGNVTECLMRVLEAADHAMGAGGQPTDPFWPQAVRQVLNYAIPLLYCAHGNVTVGGIIDFVVSAATKPEQYVEAGFMETSFAGQTMRKAMDAPAVAVPEHELQPMVEYWFKQYPAIPEKTRGNIVISLSTKLDRFKHGRMKSCFCDLTTIVPEITFHGAIIIMCMPALTWNEDGIIGQQLFKFMWQRAVESRNGLAPHHRERPVFLWADEAQYFVSVKDDDFLSTCRGSRACVVFLTQTLPTYYARLGKDRTDAADGLVGKFNTQIFHQNACNRTNTFASQLIGRDLQWRATEGASRGTNTSRGMNEGANASRGSNTSHGSSYGGQSSSMNSSSGSNNGSGENWGANVGRGTNEGESWSHSEQMDNLVEPRFFASALKSGGPMNAGKVTALWFKAGANFRQGSGGNTLLATFKQ
jgi:hypothetical protein